jgi:hypothetical protein
VLPIDNKTKESEMATKKSSRQHPVAVSPSPQADAWTVYVQSKLVELEAAKAASDRKWGENRLITLVDSGLREKFWIQNGRLHQAIGAKDRTKFDSSLAGMIRAYAVLDQWAADQGMSPASDSIPRIEWEMQSGQVMVIVRTVNETLAMQRERQELDNKCIWSMEELEVIFNDPFVQQVIAVKAFDPTAKVVSFKANEKFGGQSGFDDLESDLHAFQGESVEKKFDTKLAGRMRNAAN